MRMLLLMLFVTADPKEIAGSDDMDVAVEDDVDNPDDAQIEEDGVNDDEGVDISLVSVCEATKEAD